MRDVARSVLLVLSLVMLAAATQAADWNWTFVEPGSSALVRSGIAEVARAGNRVTAVLHEQDKGDSTLTAQLRDGRLRGGYVVVSHTDGGPVGLSQGRWLVHKMSAASTIETIWLVEPSTGHYSGRTCPPSTITGVSPRHRLRPRRRAPTHRSFVVSCSASMTNR